METKTPITDAAIHGAYVGSETPFTRLAVAARKLETDRAALIAALDGLLTCPQLAQESEAYRGCRHSMDAVAEARATLAKVRS